MLFVTCIKLGRGATNRPGPEPEYFPNAGPDPELDRGLREGGRPTDLDLSLGKKEGIKEGKKKRQLYCVY